VDKGLDAWAKMNATYHVVNWPYLKKNGYPRSSRHRIAFHCQISLPIDFIRDKMSSIGLCWSCTPAANAVVVGLGLVLFGSVLVVLYWRARRGRRRAVDLTVSQVRDFSVL
jgi:hypothetical protein